MLRSMWYFLVVFGIFCPLFSVSAHSIPIEKPNILLHEHNKNCDETAAEPVQIICILDRSGSMSKLVEDTIGGYNSFLENQKKNSGKAEVTTILFDNQYEIIADSVDINETKNLTSTEYFARGTTALLDAVGITITNTLDKMRREKICPVKRRVLIMIMTDGLENASKEYDRTTVKNLIDSTTKDFNWNYIFMGANMDSISEAKSLGISAKHAANYSHDIRGVQKSFGMMDAAVTEMRENGTVGEDWKKE